MRIDTTGNVGIGTTTISTGSKLSVYGGNIKIGTSGSGVVFSDGTFQTTAALGVTDDTSTNASYYPILSTATSGTQSSTKVSSSKLYFNPSTGTLNATIVNSLSDIRTKENISLIENSLSIIKNIKGVRFNWKDNGNPSVGVIAQDVESVIPEVVDTDPTTDIKSVNYAGIVGVLIEAVKDLSSQVKTLNDKIKDLENRS